MSTTTTKFNFVKPELTDAANITQINQNWDTIDSQLTITYRSFTEIDPSFTKATPLVTLTNSMENQSLLICDIIYGMDDGGVYPSSYGTLFIYKIRDNRIVLDFYSNVADNNSDYGKKWHGSINVGKFTGWKEILTLGSDGVVVSQNADFAEVGEWADGNTYNENRIGYFVAIDESNEGTTMIKATHTSDVRGVTVEAPSFAGNGSNDKYDDYGKLLKQYNYVAVMGIVPIIDNGTCVVNQKCMPSDDGTAIPSDNNMGYHVFERIDDTHILIGVEPSADMLNRIKTAVTRLESGKANKTLIETVTMSASRWSNGTYSFENSYPVANYDIEIALDSTATTNQAEAFNGAQIAGSATSNIAKAYGIVPTIDIPIIVKAVVK